eukprot:3426442-Rhodomonas_salina.1
MLITPDPQHHVPRLQTIDFQDQHPQIERSLANWWRDRRRAIHSDCNCPTDLEQLLQDAASVFGEISGYTKLPKKTPGRWLKGHRALHSQLTAYQQLRQAMREAQ